MFSDSGFQRARKQIPGYPESGSRIRLHRVISVYSLNNFTYSDIDEYTTSHPIRDANATCTNIQGSYFCTCRTGFSGDGKTCQGIVGKRKHRDQNNEFHTKVLDSRSTVLRVIIVRPHSSMAWSEPP